MENFRALNIAAMMLAAGVLIAPQFIYAYKINTHEVLTDASVAILEQKLGDVFTERDAKAIIKGAREEDAGTRPLQHFFDPIHNRGLSLLKNWPSAKQWAGAVLAQGNYCNFGWCPKRIGKGDALFSSPTDYSWERAVYEYAHGDKKRGLEALGHALHLVQDASVPAHVRNDQHLNHQGFGDSDPYEEFAGDMGAGEANARGTWPVDVTSVEEAIGAVAEFANKHFVSKDTLFEKYDAPSLIELNVRDGFAWDPELRHRIARVDVRRNRQEGREIEVTEVKLDDSKNSVASDYWRLLSQKSISYSAGVIELFLREVEKERQTHALLHKNKSYNDVKAFANRFKVRSGLQVALSSLSSADVYELNEEEMTGYHAAAAIYGIDVPPTARTSALKDEQRQNAQTASAAEALSSRSPLSRHSAPPQGGSLNSVIGLPIDVSDPVLSGEASEEESEETTAEDPVEVNAPLESDIENSEESDTESEEENAGQESEQGATEKETPDPDPEKPVILSYDPDSLVGSGGSARVTGNNSNSNNNNNNAPDVPNVESPRNGVALNSTSVSAQGTTTAGFLVTAEYGTSTATTTANGSGEWGFSFLLDEGTTTLSFFATDTSGDDSAKAVREVVVDTTAPAAPASVKVDECDYSLTSGVCLIATTTATVSWGAASGADFYGIMVGGAEVATTTATNTTATLADGAVSAVSVVSYDLAGNSATSTDVSVEVALQPIVINEIAWAGTDASANDEWVELYNRTSSSLALDDILLTAIDGVPEIALTGTLAAGDYYLIERTASTTTTADEDLVASFSGSASGSGLSNSGEELRLLHVHGAGTTMIDHTPKVATCSGWCAGSNTADFSYTIFPAATTTAKRTMERADTSASGALATSWQSNDGYTKQNSGDANGGDIYGTPKKENSEGYPEAGFFCGSDDVVREGNAYAPPSSACTFLSGFITGGSSGVKRWGGIYEGSVGSSTAKWGANSFGKAIEKSQTVSPDIAGWDFGSYFYAVFENRTFGSDVSDFDAYFTGSASTTPHGNFRVINWAYAP